MTEKVPEVWSRKDHSELENSCLEYLVRAGELEHELPPQPTDSGAAASVATTAWKG